MQLSEIKENVLLNNKLYFLNKFTFFSKLMATSLCVSQDAVWERLAVSGMVLKENISMFAELPKYRSVLVSAVYFLCQLWYCPILNFPTYLK